MMALVCRSPTSLVQFSPVLFLFYFFLLGVSSGLEGPRSAVIFDRHRNNKTETVELATHAQLEHSSRVLPPCSTASGGRGCFNDDDDDDEFNKTRSRKDVSGLLDVKTDVKPVILSPKERLELLRNRERAKQLYLYRYQTNVWAGTAPRNRPPLNNGTNHHPLLSDVQMEDMERQLEEKNGKEVEEDKSEDYYIKRIHTVFPSCSSATKQIGDGGRKRGGRATAKEMRLVFVVNYPRERAILRPDSVIKVKSAFLMLRRKSQPQPKSVEKPKGRTRGNEKPKPASSKNGNSSMVHLKKWKVRIETHNRRDNKSGKRTLKTVPLDGKETGWMKIDVLKTVEEWHKMATNNTREFKVKVINDKNKLDDVFKIFHGFNCNISKPPMDMSLSRNGKHKNADNIGSSFFIDSHTTLPHLEIITMVISKPAGKRRQRHLAKIKSTCAMENKYLKFQDLDVGSLARNWTAEILAPMGFLTGVCHGSCRQCPSEQNTIVTQEQNIQSCCRPIKTKPLSVLTSDKTGIKVAELHNFIVTKCGCTKKSPSVTEDIWWSRKK